MPPPLFDTGGTLSAGASGPSHTAIHYELPGVAIDEYKFITWDDRAAVTYAATSRDGAAHTVTIEAIAGPLAVPNAVDAPPQYPLLAAGNFQGTPLFIYLDAPGFTPEAEGSGVPEEPPVLVGADA